MAVAYTKAQAPARSAKRRPSCASDTALARCAERRRDGTPCASCVRAQPQTKLRGRDTNPEQALRSEAKDQTDDDAYVLLTQPHSLNASINL